MKGGDNEMIETLFKGALMVARNSAAQKITNEGFEAGRNGQSPRVCFTEGAQVIYDEAYSKGQTSILVGNVGRKLSE